MIKNRLPDKSTLAIGDGANDVSMITAAHIGIGIRGLEGQQAARASDYAISQFKYLKNLLFCHGREAYRRNAYLIAYMFYKNVLYVIPIWVFGFVSSFSATVVYNMWLYQLYNVVFTALPVMWFAVFDWEHSKEKLLNDPKMYRIGLDNVYFSRSEFWRWFFYACWQGLLLIMICFVTLDSAQEQFGQIGGLTIDGNFMFAALVIIVNVKILISSYEHSFWSLFFIFGSIASFFLVFAIMNNMIVTSTYGEMWHTYNLLQVYNLLLFFTFSYVLIDNGM